MYNKINMKKIGPCKVIMKFGANTYEIELLDGVKISPIFNVADLYPYKAEEAGVKEEHKEVQWKKKMPVVVEPQMEIIIDERVSKKTRRKEYFEYLVKWKGHPVEDASWEDEATIHRHGQTVKELMNKSS